MNTPIDVFVDLEQVGRLNGFTNLPAKIDILAEKLPVALRTEGYNTSSVSCFASYKRPREIVPPLFQTTLRRVVRAHNWNMHWSNDIADAALINTARQALADGKLAPAVMIITSDHDFVPLIDELVAATKFVFVSGTNISKRLQARANKAVELYEFLKITKNGLVPHNGSGPPGTPFNGVPI